MVCCPFQSIILCSSAREQPCCSTLELEARCKRHLGCLPDNLREAGHSPDAISHIVLTHLHPDHANGLVGDDLMAVFPNAELIMHATEYEFWMRDTKGSEPDTVQRMRARNKINLAPYKGRIRLVRDGESVLGCSPILAPGHSPGHTCWKIETGADALLAWGDTVHFSAVQISQPAITVKYDMDPELARVSRLAMLELAARDRLIILGAHLDSPGIGRISTSGAGFKLSNIYT